MARAVPVVSAGIAGLVDFSLTCATQHEQRYTNEFLTGVPADCMLLSWNPSQRKEPMFVVVLWSVVPGVAGRGCFVPFSLGESEDRTNQPVSGGRIMPHHKWPPSLLQFIQCGSLPGGSLLLCLSVQLGLLTID